MSIAYAPNRHGLPQLACPTQFSLSTAFFCMTAVAVYCVVYEYLPYWILLPYGCLIASRIVAKLGASSDRAWGLFSIGWVLVLFDICGAQLRCFETSGLSFPEETARDIMLVYLTGIVFPVVCSVWAFPALVEAFVKRRSPARKWLLLFLVITNVDLSIMAFFVVNLARQATWYS